MNQENGTRETLLRVLEKHHGEKIYIRQLADETGFHWHTVQRLVTELILEDLLKKHPKAAEDLILVPEKTVKSWVFLVPKMVEEVA